MQRNFNQLVTAKQQEYSAKWDASDLAPQFIEYFESGQRVEVEFSYGETKRGTIGITTGWKPVFLLMLTKRSRGSSDTLGKDDKVLRVIK